MKMYLKKCLLLLLLISLCSIVSPSNFIVQASQPKDTIQSEYQFLPIQIPTTFKNSWPGFHQTYAYLQISKLGIADFETSVIPSKRSYYSKITLSLQIYKNGSWKTLYSSSHGEKGSHMFERIYYVCKGYKYRSKSVIKMYKSKNGKYINSDTIYSKVKKR